MEQSCIVVCIKAGQMVSPLISSQHQKFNARFYQMVIRLTKTREECDKISPQHAPSTGHTPWWRLGGWQSVIMQILRVFDTIQITIFILQNCRYIGFSICLIDISNTPNPGWHSRYWGQHPAINHTEATNPTWWPAALAIIFIIWSSDQSRFIWIAMFVNTRF